MSDEVTADAVLLGLPGFRLLSVSERDGELEQAVETTAVETFCPDCGVQASLHDRRPSWVRDLSAGGRPVTLVWVKRVWRCHEPACPKATWTETAAAITARASLTERARAEACRRVGQDGRSVAAVAREFGCSWATIMAAVRVYGTPLVEDPARFRGSAALGVDETSFLAATATHATEFVTGLVDLGRGRLLDVVRGRSGKCLTDWLSERPSDWREKIWIAVLDPYRGYAAPLRTLPKAIVVVDAFHITKLAFTVVDEVRRRVQQDTTGHRGRAGDPLYGIRRVLRPRADRLTAKAWDRLTAALDAADRDGEIATAWIIAQETSLLYRAHDRADAARRLDDIRIAAVHAEVPELTRLARTLSAWRKEILAYYDTAGASNGPTEAMNALIKKIKRTGHGFRNFDNYRLRLLLHCGVEWDTPVTTPIRGRLPRLAA